MPQSITYQGRQNHPQTDSCGSIGNRHILNHTPEGSILGVLASLPCFLFK